MRITESRLRRMIRELIKSSNHLVNESIGALISSKRTVENPTVLNSITTNVDEYIPDNPDSQMRKEFIKGGRAWLCDMTECQDLIAALYEAASTGVSIPKLSAELLKHQEFEGVPTIEVEILGQVSEDFYLIFKNIENTASAGSAIDMHQRILYQSTVNDDFIFSVDDNIEIINATQEQTVH